MTDTALPATRRTSLEWGVFALLTALWSGAYVLTRLAVDKDSAAGLPPAWILAGRLSIGALTLWTLAAITRSRVPAFSQRREWAFIVAMGLTNAFIPFFLITMAQEHVDASIAALYAAASPIFTTIGAAFLFASERLTRATAAGVGLGFIGVLVLFGGDAMAAWGTSDLWAQVLLLFAALAYASSTLLARAAPAMPPLSFAASYVTVAAILSAPFALTVPVASVDANTTHWLAVLGLGLGSSGVAQGLYMWLVARTGATFFSLIGYTIPLGTVALGFLAFGEKLSLTTFLALALILGGVFVARRSGQGKKA